MFEGLVRQLILGYLGQYIKDIQKEQLKITLWNEEVLLEDVELILEAFDYLQLPFALKQGRVGKLSIKIPWKKLGWDPVIISLEDVLVCASKRDEKEWRMDEVERREFAGKKAKLATAELAKLSRRVCDSQAGNSFTSYITAKILDSIHLSIGNVHILYRDMLIPSAVTVFGLKLSSLTIMKQNVGGKVRDGHVNKLVEVKGLELYCSTFQSTHEVTRDNAVDSNCQGRESEGNKDKYMLVPLDVSLSLSVNRSGRLEKDVPQYFISVELNNVVVSLDEIQIRQILSICDYLLTCQLREKYGRFRPLGKKLKGWQIAWWHYAQQSVLLDVQQRLRRTSWKYLGERLNRRRKYVNLYKIKLKCLRQDQVIDMDILQTLEEIEKESEVDDILNYRSIAELELQDILQNSSSSNGSNSVNAVKPLEDEHLSSKPRGWLNWLSRGMLGAGGTDDSSQFSGVISDDVIKDIYEATKFQPVLSPNDDAPTDNKLYLSSLKFNIKQISATIRSMKLGYSISSMVLEGISVGCETWEEAAVIIAEINSAEILNPLNQQAVVQTRVNLEGGKPKIHQPSLSFQLDMAHLQQDSTLSVKASVQPLHITCDLECIKNIMNLSSLLEHSCSLHDRILSSINRIQNINARLQTKIEHVLSDRKIVAWNVHILGVTILVPGGDANFDVQKMVLEAGELTLASKGDKDTLLASSRCTSNIVLGCQLQDLYDHFEININDLEVKVLTSSSSGTVPLLEKFSTNINLTLCIIPDEPELKNCEVDIEVSSVLAHFSPSLYGAIMELIADFDVLSSSTDSLAPTTLNGCGIPAVYWFSVVANVKSIGFFIDFESDVLNACSLMLLIQIINVRFDGKESKEGRASVKEINIHDYDGKSDRKSVVFCSSQSLSGSMYQDDNSVRIGSQSGHSDKESSTDGPCLLFHYKTRGYSGFTGHECKLSLSGLDIHCHRFLVGVLVGFVDKLSKVRTSLRAAAKPLATGKKCIPGSVSSFQNSGFSNFFQTSFSEWTSVSLDQFPFITLKDSDPLHNLGGWKVLNLRDWEVRNPKDDIEDKSNGQRPFCIKPSSQIYNAKTAYFIDLELSSCKVHFHESPYVVGTFLFPNVKSALCICADYLDILCSAEGLVLSSAQWTQRMQDFLWGPSTSSSTLKLRVRKESEKSPLETSFSIQHVSCVLPPEFLAVIIGYFSFPDLTPSPSESLHSTESFCSNNTSEDNECTAFMFEILDSKLFIPAGTNGSQFLKLDMQRLYCGFTQNGEPKFVLKDIPSECLITEDEIAHRNDCLNLFGNELSLSLMLLEEESCNYSGCPTWENFIFIAPFSADVWVRLPSQCECCNNVVSCCPTCIMAIVKDCQLNCEGASLLIGCEAIMDVVDQFSLVNKQAAAFNSDILQFFQREGKEAFPQPQASPENFMIIRASVGAMSIKLRRQKGESVASDLIGVASMQLLFSASLKNDNLLRLKISFSYLQLFSSLNSVFLAECCPTSGLPVIVIIFSLSDQSENSLSVSVSLLDIWVYLFDWVAIINVIHSSFTKQPKTLMTNSLLNNIAHDPVDQLKDDENDGSQNSSHPCPNIFNSEVNVSQGSGIHCVELEGVGVRVHFPAWVRKNDFTVSEGDKHMNDLRNMIYGNRHGFFTVGFQARSIRLFNSGTIMRLRIDLDKTWGTVELVKDDNARTWPLFELFQVNLEAEICTRCIEQHIHGKVDLQCHCLDIWLSDHILCFWQFVDFESPAAGPSRFSFSQLNFEIQLRKFSLLLADGKWSSCGPLLELLMTNLFLQSNIARNEMEGLVKCEVQVNYNNIDKVSWEPFVEPWEIQLSMRRHDDSSLLGRDITSNLHIQSTTQLNLNLTEALIEVVSRTIEMTKNAWDVVQMTAHSEIPPFLNSQISENRDTRSSPPYILQNLTSLPLEFNVYQQRQSSYDLEVSSVTGGKYLQPGSSIPVYVSESLEDQILRYRPAQSCNQLGEKKSVEPSHHYISFQLEGTSFPSAPISMDLVGLRYFEVDFSKSSVDTNKAVPNSSINDARNSRIEEKSGFIVPVVVDVSMQRYSKVVRLYSTVIVSNATSVPLEVRFDIPFGVSPKVLDPIYPGQQFPLPLHLAEAGRMRWRPLGNSYLWSEAHSISSILSNENRISSLRSFVCYPSHPSSDPFRCCISVHDWCLPSAVSPEKGFYLSDNNLTQSFKPHNAVTCIAKSEKRNVHQLTLSSPLMLKNYLPEMVSVTIENAGVCRSAAVSEVETSFFHVDSSHDLTITFDMHGYKPLAVKFPRAETFGEIAKFSGTRFSLSETVTFDPQSSSDGPLCVAIEKVMDAFCGAREISILVPFLLYNCTGFPLVVSESVNQTNGHFSVITSCYDVDDQVMILRSKKDGLGILSSNQEDMDPAANRNSTLLVAPLNNYLVTKSHDSKFSETQSIGFDHSSNLHWGSQKHDIYGSKASLLRSRSYTSSQSSLKSCGGLTEDAWKVNCRMYSPNPTLSSSEIMVRLCRYLPAPNSLMDDIPNDSWSSAFTLVPPTGFTSVTVPQPSRKSGYVISVSAVAAPFLGRTRVITFQPRYVISNACNKDLCYKQKGTDDVFTLESGRHSHIQWMDTTRDLLVSIRFDEPGWQWSGCFLPEHLGDTQVKMRNFLSGAVDMIRVEVQTADVSIRDDKIVGSPHGQLGTNLILVSEDDSGFMPYRIDNFSQERLRVYQQRCEMFETMVHSYTSCPYAWDEPCYPHRLTIEVPGERVIGSYALDDVKDYAPVYLPATPEKPQRTLIVSVQSEGAVKILSIIDSSYHVLSGLKSPHISQSNDKKEHLPKHEIPGGCKERILADIPYVGISLISSIPEELFFACVRDITVDFTQSVDQQTFSLQITSLQIDNQLACTPYPVILSFDNVVNSGVKAESTLDSSRERVLSLVVTKWKNGYLSLVSFEYISLRVADFHLELDQDVILSLFDFIRTVSSRLQSRGLQHSSNIDHPLFDGVLIMNTSNPTPKKSNMNEKCYAVNIPVFHESSSNRTSSLLPAIVPIGAPWQQIHLLARKQKKIYVELFDVAPIKLTLSFSSSPWLLRNGVLTSGESLVHRGLMALADIEGAQIQLKQVVLSHQLSSWESVQEILIEHYTRQFLHEMYKVFGSAGVIGNPMGFARSMSLGLKDFLSVPVQSVFQTRGGFIKGMAQGTSSLLSNTVYALSDAATQFSKAAHKGIVAFTFDDQAVRNRERHQKGSKGVINEFLEGLTGLLQSPIKGAERHGLPGVLSGIALGVTGLVARPAASILDITGKTAQSIRNRSKLHNRGSHRFRVRLPRNLSRELPLRPYSWEEAIGVSVLREGEDHHVKLKDEILVMCKALRHDGKFVVLTERLILIVSCSCLVKYGKTEFEGVPASPEWLIEADIGLDGVIHADNDDDNEVHIVGSSSDAVLRQNQMSHKRSWGKRWNNTHTSSLPLFQTSLVFPSADEAEVFLQVLLSAIHKAKERGRSSVHLLHQSSLRQP